MRCQRRTILGRFAASRPEAVASLVFATAHSLRLFTHVCTHQARVVVAAVARTGPPRQRPIAHAVIRFVPRQRHTLVHPHLSDGSEVIEALGQHNVLLASDSVVIDVTMSQFTGTAEPLVFASFEQWREHFEAKVGQIQSRIDCSDEESGTLQQCHVMGLQKSMPASIKSLMQPDRRYCAACYGLQATKRCARCVSVYYCGQTCQAAHWKRHKIECKSK